MFVFFSLLGAMKKASSDISYCSKLLVLPLEPCFIRLPVHISPLLVRTL